MFISFALAAIAFNVMGVFMVPATGELQVATSRFTFYIGSCLRLRLFGLGESWSLRSSDYVGRIRGVVLGLSDNSGVMLLCGLQCEVPFCACAKGDRSFEQGGNVDSKLIVEGKAFIEEQWPAIIADLESLVSIDSSENLAAAAPGAPFGPGPRSALDAATQMAARYGFDLHDCEGYCGYFDIPGDSSKQLGIIGHLDVVPAGDGWTREPFALTREGDILFGRGVTDDKGPFMMGFHALRFWRDRYTRKGRPFPVSVRVIFGCSEETGMADADYYLEHYAAPDFLFTPDADFPLCYGEKGQFQVRVTSKSLAGGIIASLRGGTAPNGVPSSAEAIVRCAASSLPAADRIEIDEEWDPTLVGGDICSNYGGLARIRAKGVSGHAAMPEGSVNAIDVLAAYLLENNLCDADEREWLEFTRRITSVTDGSKLGLACEDADFGPLTCVGGMASTNGDRFAQTIDVRFPTTSSLPALHAQVEALADEIGATVQAINEVEPLLVSPDSPEVQALRSAYEQVTGCEARLFTMGGGTYAHHFPVGVSFGAMDEERFPPQPGIGGMHAANEGVQEACLRDALLIYIVALGNLFELEW